MILFMIIAEVCLLGDPKYVVKIGSINYFSLEVGGVLGMFFIFTYVTIKTSQRFQFKEEKIYLDKGTSVKILKETK